MNDSNTNWRRVLSAGFLTIALLWVLWLGWSDFSGFRPELTRAELQEEIRWSIRNAIQFTVKYLLPVYIFNRLLDEIRKSS